MEGRKRKGMGGKHRVGKGKRTEKITFYWLTHFLFWSALSFFVRTFPTITALQFLKFPINIFFFSMDFPKY